MKRYGNRNSESGVACYDDGPDFIKVQFRHGRGDIYVYDYEVPGMAEVEQMKALATAGSGLSAYISQHVGARFRRKEPPTLRLI